MPCTGLRGLADGGGGGGGRGGRVGTGALDGFFVTVPLDAGCFQLGISVPYVEGIHVLPLRRHEGDLA